MASALMIIDVQRGMFEFPQPLYRPDETLARMASLLARARTTGIPVVHIQHDGGPGHALGKGAPGWPHHPAVAPAAGEAVIEKRHSSAFHDTDLDRQLRAAGIDRLVICGAQTEMCVDSACRAAVAHGYRVALVSDGHTTFDTPVLKAEQIIAHHNQLFGHGFLEVVAADDVRF